MKVYIIFNEEKYTKEIILADLLEEGFKHEYKFDIDLANTERGSFLMDCDEVWTFGDVYANQAYAFAKGLGLEIWEMG